MVAATTAYRTQNAKMGCYQSGPTYRKEPRNSAISRCFWAFNYIYACIKDCVLIDPCMGSGHILVYAFDVLMEIYREVGYSDRDAALSIVENNLFGMDIDKRAYQLAYFAVMMKARSYNRRALTKGISNNLAVVEESNSMDKFACNGLTTDSEQNKIGEYLVEAYRNAQEIGTLQTIEKTDYKKFVEYLNNVESSAGQIDLFSTAWLNDTLPQMVQLAKQAEIMSNKYTVVCTNPPYMNKLEGQLKKFVVDNYKAYSGDLFSVFIYRNFDYCKVDGYSAFMTPFVWLFIKTYETLRKYIIDTKAITTLVQMEYSAFEEATVPICSFVLKNGKDRNKGLYFRLSDFKGGMEIQKKKVLEAIANKDCGYFYETDESNFSKIPSSSIAYWASQNVVNAFLNGKRLGDISKPRQGMATTNNNRFLRLWHEVSYNNIGFGLKSIEETVCDRKWFPYNKGGDFRKWYGNNDYVVNFKNKGEEVCSYIDATSAVNSKGRVINREHYFHECISWSLISSSNIAFRYKPNGFIFDVAGMSCFASHELLLYLLGLNNTLVVRKLLSTLAPTINFQAGDIANIPVILNISEEEKINALVTQNIELEQQEWNDFEVSWDFKNNPLICKGINTVSAAFKFWSKECNERFNQLKANEEELNRIFIDIYGLQDELTPEVEDKDITVRQADLQRDIKSLISYAVGCMFGRYSLDEDGLVYAGGEWDNSKYNTFIPDEDNCIPITDEEYFEDDIVGLFCAWLKKVYGEDTLEENLDFIANALGNKGKTSREVIRNYFLTDFIKDHIKTYQKRPIYWLFDSGKQNGFKALVYMHRWNADTIGNVRVEYLHRIQRVYEKEITRMQEIIDNSHDNKEISNATKRKEKLQKQIKETKDYDAKIAHLALSRIDIDLDDGVKVNYEKVQTADGKKMQILAKI